MTKKTLGKVYEYASCARLPKFRKRNYSGRVVKRGNETIAGDYLINSEKESESDAFDDLAMPKRRSQRDADSSRGESS